MQERIRLACLLLAAATTVPCALSCSDGGEEDGESMADRQMNIATLSGDPAAGQVVFGQTCGNGACHGEDGNSGPAPDFSTIGGQFGDTVIASIVLRGSGDMPSQSQLSDQQIADVLSWIQAAFRGG